MWTVSETSLFSMLPRRRPPYGKFAVCMVAESVALVAFVWIEVLHPEFLAPPVHDYHFVHLVDTPVPVDREPAPARYIAAPQSVESRVLRVPAAEKPKLVQPATAAPRVDVATSQPLELPPAVPVIPRQLVKTNVFSTGNSDPPTIARPPQQVQTGGFGDPNGVTAKDNKGKPVTIASLGSFSLPAGEGQGNGTNGAKGVHGVVASAGFGNDVAIGDGSGRVNTYRGTVRTSGFTSAEAMTAAAVTKPIDAPTSKLIPAEIVFKPAPIYTTEAKNLRIEGEVLLEVVFESTGKLKIVRVVRGLGHGLDESAVHAAEQIRFKPALRDGQPTDWTAVIHIIFQIA